VADRASASDRAMARVVTVGLLLGQQRVGRRSGEETGSARAELVEDLVGVLAEQRRADESIPAAQPVR
jgi:hypothetical protein